MKELRVGPINAATPTPLNENGSLDKASARRLCRRWIDQRIDGVLLLGSMGEGLFLTDAARNDFLDIALEEAGDKVTIFVSAADSSTARTMERAQRYARMGAHCVVLCLPGCGNPAAAGVAAVKAIAEACPAPCAFYENPLATGTALVLHELLDILTHPNIKVLKDSSNNELVAHAINAAPYRPDGVTLLDGVEYRTAYTRLLGYDGVLHGGGVLTARWVRRIWETATAGKIEEAIAMDRAKAMFLATIYNRFSRPLQNAAGQKYALRLLGVFDSETVVNTQSLADTDRARIKAAVDEHREWIA